MMFARAPGIDLPRRTLQRRLATLVKDGRLTLEGRGRGSRYRTPGSAFVDFGPPGSLAGWAHRRCASGSRYPPLPRGRVPSSRSSARPFMNAAPSDTTGNSSTATGRTRPSTFPARPVVVFANRVDRPDGERPAGTYARKIHHRLLIDLSWNSSRLEGNTYSLLETERLLEHGDVGEGKSPLETQMLLNHKAAIDFLVEQAEYVGFNRHTILSLHALLADNLLDPRACGRVRARPGGYWRYDVSSTGDPAAHRRVFQAGPGNGRGDRGSRSSRRSSPWCSFRISSRSWTSTSGCRVSPRTCRSSATTCARCRSSTFRAATTSTAPWESTSSPGRAPARRILLGLRAVLRPLLRRSPVSRRARSVPAAISPAHCRLCQGHRHEVDGQEDHLRLAPPARSAGRCRQPTERA